MGRSCRLPFSVNDKKSDIPLFKINSDVWGPAPVASNQRFRYYMTVLVLPGFIRFGENLIFSSAF